MEIMKRILVGLTIVGLALTGCSPSPRDAANEPDEPPTLDKSWYTGYLSEATVKLKDGRVITCIILDGEDEAGLSCDWAGARGTE